MLSTERFLSKVTCNKNMIKKHSSYDQGVYCSHKRVENMMLNSFTKVYVASWKSIFHLNII